jgi:hypothetical protein
MTSMRRPSAIRVSFPLVVILACIPVTELSGVSQSPGQTLVHPASAGPCDDPAHHQFDFWLGEWQVFDATTSQLVAFDRIESQFNGCAIIQHLTWLTDQFRRPDLGYRVSGMSVNVEHDGRWTTLWVDNTYGGGLLVEGTMQEDGSIVLTTPTPRAGKYTRGIWRHNADGTVRNVGYLSDDGKTNWKPYFDFLYRPNR